MSLSTLTPQEQRELLARGLDEKSLYFVEGLIAKKQVVMLEEVVARAGGDRARVESSLREMQASVMRQTRLLVLRRRPFRMGSWQSTAVRAFWRSADGHVVKEVL